MCPLYAYPILSVIVQRCVLYPRLSNVVDSNAAERSAPPPARDSVRIHIFLSFGFRECVSFRAKNNANNENSACR